MSGDEPPPIAEPATAAYAWSRYRRLMRVLMAVTIALMLVALRLAFQHAGSGSIRRYVLAALGVSVGMLLGSALMGLGFLLNRSRRAGENPPPARRQSDAPE